MTADAANTVLAQVEPAHDEIRAVFARQQAFAPRLRHASAAERLARLERLRKALLARREQIQRAAAADFRKPPEEVELSEIFPVLHEITHVRRHLRRWMKPKWVRPTLAMLGTRAEIRYEPKGVCLIISSWNYPFNLSFGPLVSAIAAGNTVILKPSELTPHCSRLIREIVEETFPPEEVAVFEGGVEVASALLSLPFNHIFFTGSPAVGKVVMEAAARHLASVTLELGGKSPAIVDASANLDKTVRNLVWSKFANNGQTCIAPDHVYVHASVRAEFLDKLKARIRRVYGADAAAQRSSPDYCRIVNARHFERLRGLLEDALQRGARLVTGASWWPRSASSPPPCWSTSTAGPSRWRCTSMPRTGRWRSRCSAIPQRAAAASITAWCIFFTATCRSAASTTAAWAMRTAFSASGPSRTSGPCWSTATAARICCSRPIPPGRGR